MRLVVKICGLTTPAAVRAAARAGADAIGLVLCASPRQVGLARARELLAVASELERLAVVRRPSRRELARITRLPFDGLQADADWEYARRLPSHWFFLPAFADGIDLPTRLEAQMRGQPGAASARSLRGAFLLDGPLGGGTGCPPDLERARAAARLGHMALAGGLTPENVAARIARVAPAAVDVSSGVERTPGEKDPDRIHAFVAAARAAARALVTAENEAR